MTRIRIIGLALVAVLAVSAVAASAASAHKFKASAAGEIKSKQLNNQVFTTNGKEVVCKAAAGSGNVTAGEQQTVIVKVKYTECHVKAIFEFAAEVSEAEYEFNAEGTASVINKVITINVPVAGCKVTVGPAGNANLKNVTYKNSEPVKTVEEKTAIEGITWAGTGGECGKEGKEGKYTGNNKVELPGGTIEWL